MSPPEEAVTAGAAAIYVDIARHKIDRSAKLDRLINMYSRHGDPYWRSCLVLALAGLATNAVHIHSMLPFSSSVISSAPARNPTF